MLILIIEDKASMKRQEKGDLGVRVQSSGIPSDSTGTQGDNEIMLEEAILKCDFSDGIIAGIFIIPTIASADSNRIATRIFLFVFWHMKK